VGTNTGEIFVIFIAGGLDVIAGDEEHVHVAGSTEPSALAIGADNSPQTPQFKIEMTCFSSEVVTALLKTPSTVKTMVVENDAYAKIAVFEDFH
jgi:hypothetical protein